MYERQQLLSQRFSQKELSNGDRIAEEAEALLQRGKNCSNPECKTTIFSFLFYQKLTIEKSCKNQKKSLFLSPNKKREN